MSQFCEKRVQKPSIFGIFQDFRKSGSGRCSKCRKTCKNYQKSIFSIFFEKLNLDLSFGEGFDGIRQPARFLCYFEIC